MTNLMALRVIYNDFFQKTNDENPIDFGSTSPVMPKPFQ